MEKITFCPHCDGTEFVIGYQTAQGSIFASRLAFVGTKVIHTVCKNCGAVLFSRVESPKVLSSKG